MQASVTMLHTILAIACVIQGRITFDSCQLATSARTSVLARKLSFVQSRRCA